jgi:hypothetical protein
MCATGYVQTGIAKKKSPINAEYRIEWIQCCRAGYGAVRAQPPPIVQTPKNGPVAYSANQVYTPGVIPQDYAHQYRGKRSTVANTAIETGRHSILAEDALPGDSAARTPIISETMRVPRVPFDFNAGRPIGGPSM